MMLYVSGTNSYQMERGGREMKGLMSISRTSFVKRNQANEEEWNTSNTRRDEHYIKLVSI